MRTGGLALVVSCEHAGNRVPARFASLFRDAGAVLAGHRGWDPGALEVARAVARAFDAPLRYSLTTRLLVDPNRSKDAPDAFSEFTRDLPAGERDRIVRSYHERVRRRVEAAVREAVLRDSGRGGAGASDPAGPGPVLHLGVHTFSPAWEGRPRDVDVGVLFDPGRKREAALARAWVRGLAARLPELRVRENEPYRGADDGLTTTLRGVLPPETYLGIELEVRQDLATERSARGRRVRTAVVEALGGVLGPTGLGGASRPAPPPDRRVPSPVRGVPTPPAAVPTRSR